MARRIERLDTQKLRKATAPGYYADGGGLYLQVGRGGARSWVFRYSLNGRAREMGLGSAHAVTIFEARLAARAASGLRARGIDPIEDRRAKAASVRALEAHAPTFREEAEAYIAAHQARWKNIKHGDQWRNTLAAYVYPVIGRLPVADVTTAHLERILSPIWAEKTATAARVRGRIEAVLDRAAVRKHRQGDNPARWAGHLEHLLPSPGAISDGAHHAALPFDDLPEFMTKLRARTELAAAALELCILTAARTIEIAGAKPGEFDLAARVWTVPAARMKKRRQHRVPLSDRAVAVLTSVSFASIPGFVFRGIGMSGHMSGGAMLTLLGRMGYGHVTVHGFRSTFRDWAAETTEFAPEVVEMALAHAIKDQTEAAYRRGDLFEKRRRLMDAWAEFCGLPSTSSSDVAQMHGRRAGK